MNSFKRTMTAVGTAVVLAAAGALVAPVAHAAGAGSPGASSLSALPAEARASRTAVPGTKAEENPVADATAYPNAENEFIVSVGDRWETHPVRVEVRRAGTDKVVAVVDRLTKYSEESGDSLEPDRSWFQGDDQPLVLDTMTDYELDVYAEDRDGKELSRRNAGRFTHALDARFEARTSQQEFSLDDLDTQVTGSVTAVHPRTGERSPLAGARVRTRLGDGQADVVSDAQGKFATSVAAVGNENELAQWVYLARGETEVSVKHPARIRAQKSTLTLSSTAPLTARYGTGVPVRGTLTRRADDGTLKPAAGRGVAASEQPAAGAETAYAFAGADGSYILSPRVLRTGSWNVSVRDSWLLGDGTRTATVGKVTHTTKVVEEKLVAGDKYGKLTISGKVVVDGYTTQQAPIEIQYLTVFGTWSTRQSFVVPYNKTFTVTVGTPTKSTAKAWRVHTPGTTNIGPSTGTKAIHNTRAQTQVTDERFGPRPVATGQQLFVVGTLKTYTPDRGFVAYPGQKVRFSFRPDGSTVWKEMGTAVTRDTGGVGKKFTAQTSGYWRIRFVDADAAHLTSTGMEGRIEVTG
ncbi:hypothetical protein ABZY57_14650 [Streptomyces sp. NPDC006450]|uniref:hypothetical protein n=1 Tax=Streptomyces sp. NPDC006450 TaxID=3155458 RepID=UPI0033AE6939